MTQRRAQPPNRGARHDAASGNAGLFQYTGQVWLASAGLYHYKARMYSPTLGRFLQPDPIGYADGMNLYAYVGNDPVNGTDPTGTSLLSKWMWDCVGNCSGGYANTGMVTFASARDMVSNAYPGMSSASITQVARCMVSFCNSGQLESKVSWLSSSLLVEQDGGGSGIASQAGADAPQNGPIGGDIIVTAATKQPFHQRLVNAEINLLTQLNDCRGRSDG